MRSVFAKSTTNYDWLPVDGANNSTDKKNPYVSNEKKSIQRGRNPTELDYMVQNPINDFHKTNWSLTDNTSPLQHT